MLGRKRGRAAEQPRERRRPAVASGGNTRTPYANYYQTERPAVTVVKDRQDPALKKEGRGRHAELEVDRGVRWKAKSGYIAASLIIVLALLYGLLAGGAPKVSVSSTTYHEKEYYQSKAREAFKNQSFSWLKPFVSSEKAEQILQQSIPEARHIQAGFPLIGRNPKVSITISEPKYQLISKGTTYLLDERGIVVATRKDLPSAKLEALLKIEDETGLDIKLGKAALSEDEAVFIEELMHQFQSKGISLSQVVMTNKPKEIHVLVSDRSYYIKFLVDEHVREQAGGYFAARARFDELKSQPIEYVDVRVSEKIFYR